MNSLVEVDPRIRAAAKRKHSEVWERIITSVGLSWERGWSPRWKAEVELSAEEVWEELQHGRD